MKLGLRALRGALVVSLLAGVPVPFVAGAAQAAAPAGVATLVSPEDGATVAGNPTFTWTAVPGAAKYRVQVSAASTFTSTVYTSDTVNLHATPIAPLPLGQLYWRVAPMDSASVAGQYASGSFVREWADRPELTAPAHNAQLHYPGAPPLFTWKPVEGAQSYEFQVDDDINFVGAPVVKTVNTSYTLTVPQTNGQHWYWRVRGVASPVNTEWSDVRAYQVVWPDQPTLRTPANGATVTDTVFSWDAVTGAASYLIEVSPNPDFTNNLTFQKVVTGTSYARPDALQNGSYFWRVRARDLKASPNTNLGPWSEVSQFNRSWSAAPALQSPPDDDSAPLANPTLSWTPIPQASQYEIWLGTDRNFSPGSYVTCLTNHTSYTPYDNWASTEPNAPTTCGLKGTYPQVGENAL